MEQSTTLSVKAVAQLQQRDLSITSGEKKYMKREDRMKDKQAAGKFVA